MSKAQEDITVESEDLKVDTFCEYELEEELRKVCYIQS